MTNTEIKEVIEILKKEGCNSKKQAIEYLENKLKPFKIGDRVKIINPRYSYYRKMVEIVKIIGNRYIVESDDKKFYGGLLETDLEGEDIKKWKNIKKRNCKIGNIEIYK